MPRLPILCLGFPKWEGDYMKSTVQLLSELAAFHDILYVEYPFTLTDLARGLWKPDRAPAGRLLGREPRLRRIVLGSGAQLHVLTLPPVLPANWAGPATWYDGLTRVNSWLAFPFIRGAMKQLGFDRPVVINAFQPALGRFLKGKFNERLLLYYCYDEIAAAPWIGKHGGRNERVFAGIADGIITSSRQLAAVKSTLHSRCYTVLNGVDTRLFDPDQPIREVSLDRRSFRSVAGYLGSVDSRIDYTLLGEVITGMPQTLFVFVGRITAGEGRRLADHDNVRLLGPKPPGELPAFVRAFDAAVIPFVDNALTRGIYPLKINEYLAMGKPVVSTRFGDIGDFTGMVSLAGDAGSFRQALAAALSENGKGEAARRIRFARENSWQRRAQTMDSIIRQLLSAPQTTGIH